MDYKVGSPFGIYVMPRRIVSIFKEFGYDILMKFFGLGFFDLVQEAGNIFFKCFYAAAVRPDFQESFIN